MTWSWGTGGVEGFKIEELGERAYEILDAMNKDYGERLAALGLHSYVGACGIGFVFPEAGIDAGPLVKFILEHREEYMKKVYGSANLK